MSGDEATRKRILDAAAALAVAGGLDAVSAAGVSAWAGIAERSVRRHFRDDAALTGALLQRWAEEDDWAEDAAFARARDLAADPLQVLLLGLRFLADDIEADGSRRLGAAQGALARPEGHEALRLRARRTRARFRAISDEAASRHRPREAITAEDFADMVAAVLEGAVVLGAALRDAGLPARQVRVLRSAVRRLFAIKAPAGGTATEER